MIYQKPTPDGVIPLTTLELPGNPPARIGDERVDPETALAMGCKMALSTSHALPFMSESRKLVSPPATDDVLVAEFIRQRALGALSEQRKQISCSEIARIWKISETRSALVNGPEGDLARKCTIWTAYRLIWEMAKTAGVCAQGDPLSSVPYSEIVLPRAPKMDLRDRTTLFSARAFARWDGYARKLPSQLFINPLDGQETLAKGLPIWPTTESLYRPGAEGMWNDVAKDVAEFLRLDRTAGGAVGCSILLGESSDDPASADPTEGTRGLTELWPSYEEIIGHELEWITEGNRILPRRGAQAAERWFRVVMGWSIREARHALSVLRQDAMEIMRSSAEEDRAVLSLRLEGLANRMEKSFDLRGSLGAAKALAIVRGISREAGDDVMEGFADLARRVSQDSKRDYTKIPELPVLDAE